MASLGHCSAPLATPGSVFHTAFQFLALQQCLINEDWPESSYIEDGEEFDFIVVGAGSSGSVVASRLSEVRKWNVLLIEAGGNPPVESVVPSLYPTMLNTEYDWQFITENDNKTGQAHKGGVQRWHRGKMLGGSGSINGLMYVRGNHRDYQEWYDAGLKEWHPETVFKYYKKAEGVKDPSIKNNKYSRTKFGFNGPLTVDNFNYSYPTVRENVIESMDEIGIKKINDFNAQPLGVARGKGTIVEGRRESTAKSHIIPASQRHNFHILKNAQVTRVMIDEVNLVAYGVEVNVGGQMIELYAQKEVIVSGGAVSTPQLLLLSGIGPKEHLQEHNIPVYADLPVGEYLQDHTIVFMPVVTNQTVFKEKPGYKDAALYLHNSTGYFATVNAPDLAAFFALNETSEYPDIQSQMMWIAKNDSDSVLGTFAGAFNYHDSVVNSLLDMNKEHELFLFQLYVLKPESTGQIQLRSKDPKDKPIIRPNYFHAKADVEAFIDGVMRLEKLIDTPFFKSAGAYIGRYDWEPCNQLEFRSRSYWECIAVNLVQAGHHQTSSARMGTDSKTSVVNSRLKVHGIEDLRVVDTSIIPRIISANTNGPAIMIGERAADLIKEDHDFRSNGKSIKH